MTLSSGIRRLTAVVVAAGAIALAGAPAAAENCTKAQELSAQAEQYLATNPVLAEQLLSEALGLCDRSASIRYNLATVKMMLFKYGEAKVYLQDAIRRRPDYDKAHAALSQIYMKEGDQALATFHAQKALQLAPDNMEYQKALSTATDVETPPTTKTKLPDAVAVVIGNMSYKDPLLSKAPVEYALNDARLVKEYLIQAMGFDPRNIIALENATLMDLRKVFGDERDHRGLLWSRVKMGASRVFVFYAGHGAPDTNTKKAFLVPSDADPTVIRFTSYPLDLLSQNLGKIEKDKDVKEVIVALDACFSGGYNNGMIIPDASPIFIQTEEKDLVSGRSALLTSSQKDQVSSWYPEKKHSLFTYNFLKGIKEAAKEGKSLTVAGMGDFLLGADGVNDQAWRLYQREQIPSIQGDKSLILYIP